MAGLWVSRTLPLVLSGLATAALISSAGLARADSVADFYRGKTITVDVGYGPGGGYDLTARLIAQFYGKHIPGNPQVVVENMPGGGGLKVANTLFNSAAKDGLTLGTFSSDAALEPLYGNKQAKFQPAKFSWIGSMDTDLQACADWKGAGANIRTLPDLIAAKKTLAFGASSPVSDGSTYPLFFKNALGAPVKMIYGYTGTKTSMLALERGEVDAICGIFESSIRNTYKHDVDAGDLVIFAQISLGEKSPEFGAATPVMDVIKDEKLRKLARLVFIPSVLTRPLAAPPCTPSDRVAALRAALLATEKDPETLAAAQKMKMALRPKSGAQVDQMIAEFEATPKALIKQAYDFSH